MPTDQVRRTLVDIHEWQHLSRSRDTFNDSYYLAIFILAVARVLSTPTVDYFHFKGYA